MDDADHGDLIAESRADRAALLDLRQQIKGLHGTFLEARRAEFDGLLREFAELRDDFEMLHVRDMAGDLDRSAHHAWRARAEQLTARVVKLAGTRTSG
jgi:hypothetical protein